MIGEFKMFCPKCGAQINYNDNICHKCGYIYYSNNPNYNTKSDITLFTIFIKTLCCIGIVIAIFVLAEKLSLVPEETLNEVINDVTQNISNITSDYITPIKNDTPAGYSTSETYGTAFNRYFESCKWSSQICNSSPCVHFTGIYNNQNGTYSKAEIEFAITDMGNNEFYYNINSVTIDGLDLGNLGIYGLIEDIFNLDSYS